VGYARFVFADHVLTRNRLKTQIRKETKMGFFGDMLKSAGQGIMEGAQNMQKCRSEYQSYSDSRLISIARGEGIFGSKFTEKAAALAVLKERYGEEGAKEKIRNGY